jgi:hypothetical protein
MERRQADDKPCGQRSPLPFVGFPETGLYVKRRYRDSLFLG